MTILIDLSESVIKQAALVASKYPDKTISSIIEECFNYGVKSLYTDVSKPVSFTKVKEEKDFFNLPVEESVIDSIKDSVSKVVEKAQQDIDDYVCYSEEDVPDSFSDMVVTGTGLIEL